jgi:hypothetical protein
MSLCDGGRVIDVWPMNQITVDPERMTACVDGGGT